MNRPERSISPIGSSIDVLRRQLGLGSSTSISRIRSKWPALVGDVVAEKSIVVELRNGVLTVHAADPATAEVLLLSKMRLLQDVCALCSNEEISSVAVRVRRIGPN